MKGRAVSISYPNRSIEKIETPVNEYNIPDVRATIQAVIGASAIQESWGGFHDVHHAAWPRKSFTDLNESGLPIGSMFRSTAPLLVRPPRQLHEEVHNRTLPPPPPEKDIMVQWVQEFNQVKELCNALAKRVRPRHGKDTPERRSYIQQLRLRRAIDQMQEGALGLLPSLEELYDMSPEEAGDLLLPIIRIPTVDRKGNFCDVPKKSISAPTEGAVVAA